MSAMGAVWLRLRAELRHQWRAWLALAVLLGVIGGIALTAAAGARRTDTAYPRFLRASHAAQLAVFPARSGFGGYFRAVARLPQVSSAASAAFLQMSLPGPGRVAVLGLTAEASPAGDEGVAIDRVKVAGRPPLRPGRPARGHDQPAAGGPGAPAARRHAAPDRVPAAGPQPRRRRTRCGWRSGCRRSWPSPTRSPAASNSRPAAAAEPGLRPHPAGDVVQSRWRRSLRGAPARTPTPPRSPARPRSWPRVTGWGTPRSSIWPPRTRPRSGPSGRKRPRWRSSPRSPA